MARCNLCTDELLESKEIQQEFHEQCYYTKWIEIHSIGTNGLDTEELDVLYKIEKSLVDLNTYLREMDNNYSFHDRRLIKINLEFENVNNVQYDVIESIYYDFEACYGIQGKKVVYLKLKLVEELEFIKVVSLISQLKNLQALEISVENYDNIIVDEFEKLSNLEYLHFHGIGKNVLRGISKIPNLKNLFIYLDKFDPRLLTILKNVDNIEISLDYFSYTKDNLDAMKSEFTKYLNSEKIKSIFLDCSFDVFLSNQLDKIFEHPKLHLEISRYSLCNMIESVKEEEITTKFNFFKELKSKKLINDYFLMEYRINRFDHVNLPNELNSINDIEEVLDLYNGKSNLYSIQNDQLVFLQLTINFLPFEVPLLDNLKVIKLSVIVEEERDNLLDIIVQNYSNLTNLKYLVIDAAELKSLEILSTLPSLEVLDINIVFVNGPSSLNVTGFNNLKKIKINNFACRNIPLLPKFFNMNLNKLKSISMTNIDFIDENHDENHLVNLEKLEIRNGNVNISKLSNSKNLKELVIVGGWIDNIHDIKNLLLLEKLWIVNSRGEGVTGTNSVPEIFRHLPNLAELKLDNDLDEWSAL